MAVEDARYLRHGDQQPNHHHSGHQHLIHQYPPKPPTSSTTGVDPLRGTEERNVDYLVHTEAQGLSDLRLYVSPVSEANSDSEIPVSPVYSRERTLTENNEIVDRIMDVRSGRVCWTVHRPTRGWYLYLRSLSFPTGAAVSMTSAKMVEHDASISPLTFTLTVILQRDSLARINRHVEAANPNTTRKSTNHVLQDTSTSSTFSSPYSNASNDTKGDIDIAIASGREDSMKSERGHARKRSAAGSGNHSLADRKPNRKSIALPRSPMIPEVNDESGLSQRSGERLPKIKVSIPHSCTTDADLPYSPAKPNNHSNGDSRSNSNKKVNGEQRSQPCTFFVCDGSRRPQRHSPSSTNTEQSLVSLKGQQSWARWAWSVLPQELRPELPSGTSKNFSVYWIDAPPEIGGPPDDAIEILHFQDHSGWWMWNSQTRGKLTLQTHAIEALGLEQEFWVTVALAYIQFLEERDSYEAARFA